MPGEINEGLVRTGGAPVNRDAAIREVGNLLVAAGCAGPEYIESMLKREDRATTFLGSGVAIPHGLLEDKALVLSEGVAVLQVPGGVEWLPGRDVRLVVGIAAASDGHIAILRRLTRLMRDDCLISELCTTASRTRIVEIFSKPVERAIGKIEGDYAEKIAWVLDYPAGLHARPAFVWSDAARALGLPMRIRNGECTADPRNMISLLQLGAKAGDILVISAQEPNAAEALESFRKTIVGLSAEEKAAALAETQIAAKAAKPAQAEHSAWVPMAAAAGLAGMPASPSIAIGKVHRPDAVTLTIHDNPVPLSQGGAMLEKALDEARNRMRALADDAARRMGAGEAAIFKAQAALLDDSNLIAETCKRMAEGHGPAWAWNTTVEEMAAQLETLENKVLAARAADLRDVARCVLLRLEPQLEADTRGITTEGPVILIVRDLSPSDAAALDPAKVIGLVCAQGGPSSHAAILARTLGITAVVAAGEAIFEADADDIAIVDGDSGHLWLRPTEDLLNAARAQQKKQQTERAARTALRSLPGATADARRVEVAANINSPKQAAPAIEEGAEGVGLMRTEFLFLELGHTPGEDEQYTTYYDMMTALDGRPLVIRTLDIGGDKQVAYLDLPREQNPFLGVRGSRLQLRRNDLFEPQLRAIYRAAADCRTGSATSVMFPMIASVAEVVLLRKRCEEVRKIVQGPELPLGIMVEVPSAAIMAEHIAEHVDFFSIGTNDLTQYTLAMDRENPELAVEADGMHPAVLRLIKKTVQGAEKYGRWVGVCGGLAGDPFGAALLTGLGVNGLSMTPHDIPPVKAMLRKHKFKVFQGVAERALALSGPAEVRKLAVEL